jgi:6-phosphogluconolactonase
MPLATPDVRILPAPDDVSAAAAAEIARVLAGAVRDRGVAHWSTTGGSAAPPIYAALAAEPLRSAVDWSRVHVWWGDDRFVAADDALSNVLPFTNGMVEAQVPLDATRLHPIRNAEAIASGGGPAAAAAAYAAELAAHAPAGPDGVPVLDLVILGVGPDGHVLSVFPGSAVWDAPELVVGVPAPTHVEPHVARVTMHPRVLPAAREVLVVTTGASKAAHLGDAWTGDDVRSLPLRATRLPGAVWILDEAAAADLPGR